MIPLRIAVALLRSMYVGWNGGAPPMPPGRALRPCTPLSASSSWRGS